MKLSLQLEPVDTLFFRDARPMQAGSAGHGASWPMPTVVHEALRAALLRRIGSRLVPRSPVGHFRNGHRREIVTRDFESLRACGPFPFRGDTILLPTPADCVACGEGQEEAIEILAPVSGAPGSSNLPAAWLRPVGGFARAGKRVLPRWVPLPVASNFLAGKAGSWKDQPLWMTEHRIGVGIDPVTRAAVD